MTGKFVLSKRSLANMDGLHPGLIAVIHRAIVITPVDFGVIEGLRTVARQKQLVAAGASHTMRSRHLTGHAADLGAFVAGQLRWDWPLYELISVAMKAAAKELDVPLEWGGDWQTLKDGPHYQLPCRDYP